jgi:hypothetical protein
MHKLLFLPYLHYNIYYIPFELRIFIFILLAYLPMFSTVVSFFHIFYTHLLIIIMINVYNMYNMI